MSSNNQDEQKVSHSNKITTLKKRVVKYYQNLYIYPESLLRLTYDFIVMIVIVYNTILAPLVGFFQIPMSPALWFFNALIDFLALINVVFLFLQTADNAGIQEKDRLLNFKQRRKKIMIELLALLPMDYIMLAPLWRLFRLIQLSRFLDYYKYSMEKLKIRPNVVRLLQSIGVMFVLIHFLGCVWYYTSVNDKPLLAEFDHTISIETLRTEPLYFKYIRACYWSISFLTGFSNPWPDTFWGVFVSLFIISIGAGVFATIIGTVNAILRNWDAQQQAYTEKKEQLREFMNYRKLPSNLRQDIHEYYDFMYQSRQLGSDDDLLYDLPKDLKEEVSLNQNLELLKSVEMFRRCNNEAFLGELFTNLKYMLVLKGYYIVRQGDVGKEMFFIKSGKVEVFDEESDTVHAQLGSGKIIGEMALLAEDSRRNASIKAITLCELYTLSKDAFDSVLMRFPETKKEIDGLIQRRTSENSQFSSSFRTEAVADSSGLSDEEIS
eukprot:gb/GECH01000701.1/.p1 GENE.gb/GECH01000701.1/~~gb/GECH01000701.1/.p1  ORF type:complete len:493 (+),score=98.64 gb/GECH01000701.1/:1-1479(+)